MTARRFWLTTQWPPLESEPRCTPRDMFLDAAKAWDGAEIRVGDYVLIYQCKGGTPGIDEAGNLVPRWPGAQGIIAVAEVVSPFRRSPKEVTLVKGRSIHWKKARLRLLMEGTVPRLLVNKKLGFKPGNVFRGYGIKHTGIGQLERENFERLVALLEDEE